MKYLIVDLNIKLDGHKYGFIDNLIKYVGKNNPNDQFAFLYNHHPEVSFENEYSNVQLFQLSQTEQDEVDQKKRMIYKSEAEWKIIENYQQKLKSDRLILMELDLYQISIGKRKSGFKISGIWFRPYLRMQPESSTVTHRLNHFKHQAQKKSAMMLALSNQALDRVFILNDEEMPGWMNKKNKRFFTLPDPYFEYQSDISFGLRKHYNIPDDNLILLQFGYMDSRKNNENIIAALNNLSDDNAKNITLLIVGKFEPGYEEELKKLKQGKYQLITRNEFITNEEMESTFAQSDVILRMNVGFFGSSGVVGIAARHNKPVIVSNTGVMAGLVEKYQLGFVIDPSDKEKIKEIILKLNDQPELRKINGKKYRDTHSLSVFAETLLT